MPEPRIWILPSEVAERIAAGEVVERPASVVKELVENALDAGARRITVETQGGGKHLIRVSDDGQGMTGAEARLALQRHATSKLRTAEDLFNIHTLGFRGEALPSIAAVSELEILTRTPDSAEGTRLLIVGGVVRAEEPAAAQVGTTITVQRLFFNVPVREKFLRADTTEAGQITDWLQRLALSHCEVSFRLVHDGREALLSPGSEDPLNAVVSVLGRAIARDLIRLPEVDTGAIRVSGFAGRPTLTRANRGFQHSYVNGRAVRSPLFYRALDDAFRATMPHGRYPVALLFLDVPPDSVDVNVHPAKTEVRFQNEPAVHAAILRTVRAALQSSGALPAPTLGPEVTHRQPGETEGSSSGPSRVGEPGAAAPPAPMPFADQALNTPPARTYSGSGGRTWPAVSRPLESPAVPIADPFAEEGGGSGFTAPPAARPQEPPPAPMAQPSGPAVGALTLLGQAQDLFILAEAEGQLWIIDQHVAHERVLFDRMTAPGAPVPPSEPLLIPMTLDVDHAQAVALEEHHDLLIEAGFTVEPFGPGRYTLRAVPGHLVGRNYETVFRDLVDELAELSRGGQVKLGMQEIAMAAAGRSCKRAVKAGQKLGAEEMERLLADLRTARNPHTCPHGRPVFLTFSEDEIAALFGNAACD